MRHGAAQVLVVTGLIAFGSNRAAAQGGIFEGMQKGVETVFSISSTSTTFADGTVSKTRTTSFYPALTLNLDGLLFPSLRLNAGGVFEINMLSTTVDRDKTESTISRNRPFILLRSTNPVFAPGISAVRREDRSRTAGSSDVKLIDDEYGATLDWNVIGGPRSLFQLLRTHTFDGTKALQDIGKTFGSVLSNYTAKGLSVYYRGSYLDTNDRLRLFDTRQVANAIRGDYSGAFFAQRLQFNTTYDIGRQDIRTIANGSSGDVAIPVAPFAGLAVASDTPVTSTLSQNVLLIDGNLAAAAGVDLGLPATTADALAKNIGFDFLTPTEVSRILVWVDRDLPIEVTNSFSWDVYSSTDNLIWNRETTITAAPFGPFETRFQLDFPSITARYLKVVTRPLSVVVPNASQFPDIFVTEVQAFVSRPAGEATRLRQTSRQLNTDARLRVLDTPQLFLETSYLSRDPGGVGAKTDTLSNGLSINHAFGKVLSVFARGAREQGAEADGYRTATLTSGTLTVDPMPTLRSSFLYTGQDERIAGVPRFRRSLFLQNSARPYRGVDVLFGYGRNYSIRETGEVDHDQLVNASATIVPRQRLSFTGSYDELSTTRTGTFLGAPQSVLRRAYASVAIDPFRTLHAVVGGEFIGATGQKTRNALDINVNWSPFPDGTLQLVFASTGALRALDFGRDRSTVAAVRWNVSRRSYIDVSYQTTKSELVSQTTVSKIFSVTARVFP